MPFYQFPKLTIAIFFLLPKKLLALLVLVVSSNDCVFIKYCLKSFAFLHNLSFKDFKGLYLTQHALR